MSNKELQEQRIRGYFLDATREILKGEGLKSISVRNIAERAGYSYATLYNYFKDIKELVFECVKDFQRECEDLVIAGSKRAEPGLPKIKSIALNYIRYFVQYPGTFELFFIERTSDIAGKQPILELIATFLDRLFEKEWEYCVHKKIMSAKDARLMNDHIKYAITGLLLFYINRRSPSTYKEFEHTVELQLNYALSKHG